MPPETMELKRLSDSTDLKRLSDSITQLVRRRNAALCAACLTSLAADAHGADNVDIRVAMVDLALGPGFTSGGSCDGCGQPERHRNPVLRPAHEA